VKKGIEIILDATDDKKLLVPSKDCGSHSRGYFKEMHQIPSSLTLAVAEAQDVYLQTLVLVNKQSHSCLVVLRSILKEVVMRHHGSLRSLFHSIQICCRQD
jgi:hypothetical protein